LPFLPHEHRHAKVKTGKKRKLALVLVVSRQIKLFSFVLPSLLPWSYSPPFVCCRLLPAGKIDDDPLIYFPPVPTLSKANLPSLGLWEMCQGPGSQGNVLETLMARFIF
jgi:hypothetical protein